MAVSQKTNNLINCSRCHLPFNFTNAVPKLLPCKHWYCMNCLEQLIHKNKDSKELFCIQCQNVVDLQEIQSNKEKGKLPQLLQYCNSNNNNNDNKNTNIPSFGGDEEFNLKDFEANTTNTTTSRSASMTSDNSIGSLFFSNNEIEGNFNLMISSSSSGGGGGQAGLEKMLPGENCFIHGMPNTLWCNTCMIVLCRGCNSGPDHMEHKIKNQLEAKDCYQKHIKQEFLQIQDTLGDMENLKLLQKQFLLKILDTCCSLKQHIENELVATTNTMDMDEMRESMLNMQLCFDLLGKQTPNEIFKLYNVIKDENTKFRDKHRQMLQQFKMQQLLSKSDKIIDFDIIKQIFQKFQIQDVASNFNDDFSTSYVGNRENNSMMILTNYCIYRLYGSYIKQQQQFVEEQFIRYQQYHYEQKQSMLKQFKMLQQQQQHQASPITTYQNHATANNQKDFRRELSMNYSLEQNKPQSYAEIIQSKTNNNITNLYHHDNTDSSSLDLSSSQNFQPYKKPSTKSYEESRKTVNLLFNPINNDNNQIYYFDFERNTQHFGRILIKVFADIAPKMSFNFHALTTHDKGFGYIGCKIFECHPNESIITGDIEQNTGYSSRSIYEDVQFVPDDTNIAPFAGAVGMRRAKKKFDSQGLVGSQFRIILTELGFTAIFGCVIEGLDVVKKISQTIVQNDKIHGGNNSNGSGNGNGNGSGAGAGAGIFINQCGLYEFVKRDILGAI